MPVVLVAAFAVLWLALTGTLGVGTLLGGAAVGVILLMVLGDPARRNARARGAARAGMLAIRAVLDFAVSGWRLSILAAMPDPGRRLRPAVLSCPIPPASDAQLVALAAAVSALPGVLALDLAPDRPALVVHVLDERRAAAVIDAARVKGAAVTGGTGR